MQRQIYIVDAHIVDSNGTFNYISGYPKPFDSRNYNNDIERTLKRARADAAEQWAAFCKRDDRQLQVVSIQTASGYTIGDPMVDGQLENLPD